MESEVLSSRENSPRMGEHGTSQAEEHSNQGTQGSVRRGSAGQGLTGCKAGDFPARLAGPVSGRRWASQWRAGWPDGDVLGCLEGEVSAAVQADGRRCAMWAGHGAASTLWTPICESPSPRMGLSMVSILPPGVASAFPAGRKQKREASGSTELGRQKLSQNSQLKSQGTELCPQQPRLKSSPVCV